jgi:hypothetical protein
LDIKWYVDIRRLICNEFLSLNAFGFVFYHDNRRDFLRLRRFAFVFLVFAFVFLFILLAFILLVLLVLLVLAPPPASFGTKSYIATDLLEPAYTKCAGINDGSNTWINLIKIILPGILGGSAAPGFAVIT